MQIFSFKICFCKILCIEISNTIQSLFCQQTHFHQIKSKMTANNMSNVHLSPDVLSTLLLLWQGIIYKLQQKILHSISRSNCPEAFWKKLLLKLRAEFTVKHLCQSLFNNIADLQTCNFIKKRLQHGCFPVNILKVSGTVFL